MLEVVLIIHSPRGDRQVSVAQDHVSLGRGSAATVCIDDKALSRLHASLHREGNKIWIADEGSINGTYVNDDPVTPIGTVLADGDEIRLGDQTRISIRITGPARIGAPPQAKASTDFPRLSFMVSLLLVVVVLPGAWVCRSYLKAASSGESGLDSRPTSREARVTPPAGPVDQPGKASPDSSTGNSNSTSEITPPQNSTDGRRAPENGKLRDGDVPASSEPYAKMTEAQKREFIDRKAHRIAEMIGNRGCAVTDEALDRIKYWVDQYARRIGRKGGTGWGEDLTSVFRRASTYGPLIIPAFRARDISAIVAVYLPMIETEYRPYCSENHARAKGLFQFLPDTARAHGVDPADRCDVKKMAPAAADYMASRISEFGPDAIGVGLAIAGYNRDPNSVRRDLTNVVNSANKERSFWTLVANKDKLDSYFQKENINYVIRLYSFAIIGENPWNFGLDMKPLTTYAEAVKQ